MDLKILRLVFLLSLANLGRPVSIDSDTSCPVGCNCNLLSIHCCRSDQYLQIPVIGADNITKLQLTSCPSFELSSRSVRNFPFLEELIVKSTPITYIDANAFANFPRLKSLFLNGLNLSANTIHPSAFNNLSVQELNLGNNNLIIIQHQMFSGLQNLRVLDLSVNKIGIIQDRAFESLQQLSVLNLENNKLKTVTPNWFKALSHYSFLEIRVKGNNLTRECNYRGMELVDNQWFTKSIKPNDSLTQADIKLPACSIPIINNNYQNIYIKELSSVIIYCSANGIPKPTSTWLLPNGLDVMSGYPFFSADYGKLNISRVKASDSGVYACVATNSEGSAVAITRLSVITNSSAVLPNNMPSNSPNKKASLVLLVIFIVILSLILGFVICYFVKMVYKLAKKNSNTHFEFSRFVDTPNILQVPENPQPMPHL
ncbi:leucine-rich repeat and immunoglobulin-like domain-containing nogo receptor-interacting protein 3 [Pelobates fuscus]|uniref:leucine-rich repeat and immunoglobulin-like domain-containing nogo receptor-interacting protein 3 n=1 Tax=Pelobates fuscus TaxID=191477 RepID=UPI002FE45450